MKKERCILETGFSESRGGAILLALLALCLLSSFWITPILGIRFNVSPSLPKKLFISTSFTSPHRGQYITFEHSRSKIPIAKQIIGIPGDSIAVHDQQIYVNGQDYGKIQDISPSGMLLTPISETQVPEGYIFAYAPHPESFDSRYQEFGLVKIDHIKKRLCPIF